VWFQLKTIYSHRAVFRNRNPRSGHLSEEDISKEIHSPEQS